MNVCALCPMLSSRPGPLNRCSDYIVLSNLCTYDLHPAEGHHYVINPDWVEFVDGATSSTGWHVEERSYGSFYRSMSLPFKPADGVVEAHFDKGILHVTVKKPAEVTKNAKTIEIKAGPPPKAAG